MKNFLLLLTAVVALYQQQTAGLISDAKSGLNCITLDDGNKTMICTGTNTDYVTNRDVAKKNKSAEALDIQTRFFRPPCRGYSDCTAFQSTYSPTLMQNKWGQDRYIYQDDDFGFTQAIRVVTCRGGPCGRQGECKQSYRDYVMISWDPHSDFSVPITDVFSVPDCCGCAANSYWGQGQGIHLV